MSQLSAKDGGLSLDRASSTSPTIHPTHIDIGASGAQSTAVAADDNASGAFTNDSNQVSELQGLLEQFDPLTRIRDSNEATLQAQSSGISANEEITSNEETASSEQAQSEGRQLEFENNTPAPKLGWSGSSGSLIDLEEESGSRVANKNENQHENEAGNDDDGHSEPKGKHGENTNETTKSTANEQSKDGSEVAIKPVLSRFSSEKSISSIPKDPNEDRPFDFQRFLDQLRHKSADPIARYVKSFLNEFNKRPWTTNEQVKIIADFKEFIANKMYLCAPFSTLSEHEMMNATEGMEKLIMNRLYGKTFSPEIVSKERSAGHEEDILRDRVLEEKMRIWHWIEGRHLDIGDRFLRNGEAFVKLASDELTKINHYRAPRDKVICILNCCKVIFGLLRQTNSEESADGFLPLLIFVVIKAQPKDLISNANYIERFRNPNMLNGETGYYLNSLISAVAFIEQLDRSQLSITEEEFDRNVELSVKKIAEPVKEQEQEQEGETSLSFSGSEKSSVPDRLKPHQQQPPSTPERGPSPAAVPGDTSTEGSGNSTPVGGMNASQVLYSSAGLFTAPFRSVSRLFESDPADTSKPDKKTAGEVLLPEELAARQVSAEDYEARRIHQNEFESVAETLKQMFPLLDKDIIEDVLREKEGRVGAAVDACLSLVV